MHVLGSLGQIDTCIVPMFHTRDLDAFSSSINTIVSVMA